MILYSVCVLLLLVQSLNGAEDAPPVVLEIEEGLLNSVPDLKRVVPDAKQNINKRSSSADPNILVLRLSKRSSDEFAPKGENLAAVGDQPFIVNPTPPVLRVIHPSPILRACRPQCLGPCFYIEETTAFAGCKPECIQTSPHTCGPTKPPDEMIYKGKWCKEPPSCLPKIAQICGTKGVRTCQTTEYDPCISFCPPKEVECPISVPCTTCPTRCTTTLCRIPSKFPNLLKEENPDNDEPRHRRQSNPTDDERYYILLKRGSQERKKRHVNPELVRRIADKMKGPAPTCTCSK